VLVEFGAVVMSGPKLPQSATSKLAEIGKILGDSLLELVDNATKE
jgi:hypothetical protein